MLCRILFSYTPTQFRGEYKDHNKQHGDAGKELVESDKENVKTDKNNVEANMENVEANMENVEADKEGVEADNETNVRSRNTKEGESKVNESNQYECFSGALGKMKKIEEDRKQENEIVLSISTLI